MTTIIILGLITLVGLYVIIAYNGLASEHAKWYEEAWSGIDVQLKRRSNLIPNLLETVKGICQARKRNTARSDGHAYCRRRTVSGDVADAQKPKAF